jgi:ADP-ribose pyrophosphatase
MMTNEKTTRSAKLEDRKVVYEGRVFRLEVDRVLLPSGHRVSMDIVRHPGSVVLIPMPAPDQVILIRQYRYTIDRWIWELPAGSLAPGEEPAGGAARECEEEIGLVPGSVRRMRSFYPTPGFCDEEMIFFRCTDLQIPPAGSTAHQDEDEDLEPRTFDVEEARRMVREGEIVDLKTAIGLTLI